LPTDLASAGGVVLGVDTCGNRPVAGLRIGSEILTEASTSPDPRADDAAGIITRLFASAGIEAADLTGIGVTTGPGSYTGVRIGLALVRGISLVDRVATVGVGSLELLALSVASTTAGSCCSVLDAGGGKYYAAVYERRDDELFERVAPHVAHAAELADLVARHTAGHAGIVVGCETEMRPVASARYLSIPVHHRVATLVEHASRRLREGAACSADRVMPTYVGAVGARPNRDKVVVDAEAAK
jgi:tRNA threonylcarbamoyladenosine biosynthesis protein TsaB